MTISERIAVVQAQIADACARAGRSPESVTLVAVSKQKPAEDILAAIDAGLVHFGENRPEELEQKQGVVMAQVKTPVRWHMIGHVQSRKVRMIPALFDMLESVDSVKLAAKVAELAVENGKTPFPVLIQVNVSGEETKGGFEAFGWERDADVLRNVAEVVRQISALEGLDVRGLMTMAPIVDDMEATRPVFASLRALRDALQARLGLVLPDLSMGMTDDFPVAIEEGATIVRVGRAIFGERPIKN